ncbi:MAG: DUF192 domain-containing protein [Candidatus Hydrothermarchaeales archaeon]
MMIRNLTKDNMICEAEEARSFLARARGLMLKQALGKNKGLLLRFSFKENAVHSFFMRFTIDLIFLDNAKNVVDLYTLKPWRVYRPKKACHWVIEVNHETITDKGIELGDKLEFD